MTTLIIILVVWAISSTILLIICILGNFGICIDKKYFQTFGPKLLKKFSQSNETKSSSVKDNQSIESICHEVTNDIQFTKTPIEIYSKRHVLNIEIPPNSGEPSIIDPVEYYTLSRNGDSQLNNITHEEDLKIFPIIDGKHKYVPCYISQRKNEPTLYCLCNRLEISIYEDRRIPVSEKILFFYIMKVYKTLVIWLGIGVIFLFCLFIFTYCKEFMSNRFDE
ncbi:Hypothetical protein SRAE_X000007100 [Strongyloides ratti]|uniref:TMEM248/TMEM219 domain-containing protein n=1 Tax=Strongyloides ratti TaxID=34506 RepID=A0A090LLR2_STRRB|nr:Hypothetical protein SRAE_X000007100 [Strongyloides ratti]CEF70740.1 Hypothetical protein SRAE_X000007100 [Strongyloides ratti]